jgi:Raf kinase inhibitor-like YbhB/YbcL family protein
MSQGRNSWSRIGYNGPFPPRGSGRHRYHFKLYALNAKLQLDPGATKQELLDAMQGHIVGEAKLIGTYERK